MIWCHVGRDSVVWYFLVVYSLLVRVLCLADGIGEKRGLRCFEDLRIPVGRLLRRFLGISSFRGRWQGNCRGRVGRSCCCFVWYCRNFDRRVKSGRFRSLVGRLLIFWLGSCKNSLARVRRIGNTFFGGFGCVLIVARCLL